MTERYDWERLVVLAEQVRKAAAEYEAAHGKSGDVSDFANAAGRFLAARIGMLESVADDFIDSERR